VVVATIKPTVPLALVSDTRIAQMNMHGKCSLLIAFDDPEAESLEDLGVVAVLQEILNFARDTIVPTFEPFRAFAYVGGVLLISCTAASYRVLVYL
jgi:hypothetical protein